MNSVDLNDTQKSRLADAFAEIAVLIGSADGAMSDEEKLWSQKISHIRTFAGKEELFDLYKEVENTIDDKINRILTGYPDREARENMLIEKLVDVNEVLGQLDNHLGSKIYKDLRSFAMHVAKASGGFMRFFSVSRDEREWAELPMINEVIWEEEA
jgi:hypothetical protein